MLILVNRVLVDTQKLLCGKRTLKGERCLAYAGNQGLVEVAYIPNGDGTIEVKVDVTCGIHINKQAGDDVRFTHRLQAMQNLTLIDTKATITI